ncbi:hypothetical protein As57867_019512, partial [Aphanomyces stellatus]
MPRITLDLLRKRSEHNEGIVSTLEEISLHQEEIEKIEVIGTLWFIKDPNIQLNFLAPDAWEQLIDSDDAILTLSGQLKPDYLCGIFNWAKAAGHASLAGSVFELYLHLLAADI